MEDVNGVGWAKGDEGAGWAKGDEGVGWVNGEAAGDTGWIIAV